MGVRSPHSSRVLLLSLLSLLLACPSLLFTLPHRGCGNS